MLNDSLDGQILRAAGREQVVAVATVVERFPETFKTQRPAIEWVKIQRMRNMVAGAGGDARDYFVWETLPARIPELLRELAVDGS